MAITVMAAAADKVTVTVSNTLKTSRAGELAEVSVNAVKAKLKLTETNASLVVTDADGKEVPSQLTHDGKLVFPVGVAAKGKSTYYIQPGTPQQYDKRVSGRLFTERQDEFGWENDRVAYRIYGHGGAVGYDLFNKKTSKLMLDWWYKSEENKEMRSITKQLRDRGYGDLADEVYNAYCYHIDHGEGMDCYTVGPTLGGGGDALINKDGSLCLPKCYQKYEILDQGPLRFTVRLTYPEIEYEGQKVTETRVLSLDAGSHFNCVTVSYAGLSAATQLAAGVVVHKQNPTAYVINKDAGYIGYEDLGDVGTYSYINKRFHEKLGKEMGKIYVGTIHQSPVVKAEYQERPTGAATGHVLGISDIKPAGSVTYYFGSAWDQNPETGIKSLTDWEAKLSQKAQQIKSPLKITLK